MELFGSGARVVYLLTSGQGRNALIAMGNMETKSKANADVTSDADSNAPIPRQDTDGAPFGLLSLSELLVAKCLDTFTFSREGAVVLCRLSAASKALWRLSLAAARKRCEAEGDTCESDHGWLRLLRARRGFRTAAEFTELQFRLDAHVKAIIPHSYLLTLYRAACGSLPKGDLQTYHTNYPAAGADYSSVVSLVCFFPSTGFASSRPWVLLSSCACRSRRSRLSRCRRRRSRR